MYLPSRRAFLGFLEKELIRVNLATPFHQTEILWLFKPKLTRQGKSYGLSAKAKQVMRR